MFDKGEFGEKVLRDSQGLTLGWLSQENSGQRRWMDVKQGFEGRELSAGRREAGRAGLNRFPWQKRGACT